MDTVSTQFTTVSNTTPPPVQKIRLNNTLRDSIQSLMGADVPAAAIAATHPNAGRMTIGDGTLQTNGGTLYAVPASKDREPNEFINTINAAYPDAVKTALFRNECGVGYEASPYDVIKATLRAHAEAGVQVFQNFHGLNDTARMESVAHAVQELREETGLDISAQGGICIEDNPNITLESCVKAAKELIESGHKGLYLKSASGRIDAGFVRELVTELLEQLPEQTIDIHVHDTYGEAIPAYMAAIEAAAARGKIVGVDVLHPAIAGNTAQPDILKMRDAILAHPDEKVRAGAPDVNMDAIEADRKSLLELRARYRDSETKYNPRLLSAMRAARAPGGASSTLRAIPGLEANLSAALGTTDWDEIQIAVYEMQAEILPRLGNPTQVTPYAMLTTTEAAFAVLRKAQGKDPLASLTGPTANYLAGGLGKVPESADPKLVSMALTQLKLDRPIDLSANPLPPGMETARAKLQERGIENPADEDVLIAAVLRNPANPNLGVDFVEKKHAGKLNPAGLRPLPRAYLEHTEREGLPVDNGQDKRQSLLRESWMSGGVFGIQKAPPLSRGFIEHIGGPAAFEELAQAVVTLQRHIQPPAFAMRPQPEYLMAVDKKYRDQARDIITDFHDRVGGYAQEHGFSHGAARHLNTIIQDMCAGKGISEINTGILAPFHAREFAKPRQTPVVENTLRLVASN
ncbi:MAG: hypothetical protein IT559_09250 [Alphaproteobacteria bacterium]|nr:hypothetical protein [Alphaproteobacteria bacterium]